MPRLREPAISTQVQTVVLAVASAVMLLVSACRDPRSNTAGPIAPAGPSTVRVTALIDSVTVDSTLTMSAEVLDVAGRVLPGVPLTWASSDSAVLTVDAQGVVTGRSPGSATVRAVAGGLVGSKALRVVRTTLSCGVSHRGSIAAPGEVDIVRYPGTANDFLTLTLVETGGFPTQFQTVRLTLLRSARDSILQFNAGGRHDVVLPGTGEYLIRLLGAPASTTGSYILNVACLDSRSATAIRPGDLIEAGLDQPSEVDVFTFPGVAGRLVSLATVETSGFATMFSAPQAVLYSPSRDTVSTTNSLISQDLVLTETGPYLIRMAGNPTSATGTYALVLEGIDPPSPDSVPLAYNTTHSGELTRPAEIDIFTLHGTTGETVVITLVETGGFATQFAAPRLTLYSPSRSVVIAFTAGQRQLTLAQTGRYVLRVDGAPISARGTYNLRVQRL